MCMNFCIFVFHHNDYDSIKVAICYGNREYIHVLHTKKGKIGNTKLCSIVSEYGEKENLGCFWDIDVVYSVLEYHSDVTFKDRILQYICDYSSNAK